MDEKVVEEIRMHQETIATDGNSPLHMIREKELEISGRMLAAKRQADEIVADARRKAAEVVSIAEHEGGTGAAAREQQIRTAAEAEAADLIAKAEAEAVALRESVASKREQAVALVLEAVTTV